MKKKIVVAITGASGVIYGLRTIGILLSMPIEVHACVSEAAKVILGHESAWNGADITGFLSSFCDLPHSGASLKVYDESDFFAAPASGSFIHSGMIIAPCSMKTAACVANGIASNLVHRAADVCLKEKRPLLMVTRETPLNLIHIENMRKLVLAGAVIMPASPSFYSNPATVEELVDTVTARILDHMCIFNEISPRWGK